MKLSQARKALSSTIHSPMRLSIMAALHSVDSVDFQTLKDDLGCSYALLSKHASLLAAAGFVQATKHFEGTTPSTYFQLTATGRRAFAEYLDALERIMAGISAKAASL